MTQPKPQIYYPTGDPGVQRLINDMRVAVFSTEEASWILSPTHYIPGLQVWCIKNNKAVAVTNMADATDFFNGSHDSHL